MSYRISHWYTGHNYILEEFDNKIEAVEAINRLVNDWGEPSKDDEFLELYYHNEETGEFKELFTHNLTDPDTWEDD